MDIYFSTLIDRLSIHEIEFLNYLTSNEATNRFSAITRKSIVNHVQATDAQFRKITNRLEALNFIEIVSGQREHLIYVTKFGQQAIQTIYERGKV